MSKLQRSLWLLNVLVCNHCELIVHTLLDMYELKAVDTMSDLDDNNPDVKIERLLAILRYVNSTYCFNKLQLHNVYTLIKRESTVYFNLPCEVNLFDVEINEFTFHLFLVQPRLNKAMQWMLVLGGANTNVSTLLVRLFAEQGVLFDPGVCTGVLWKGHILDQKLRNCTVSGDTSVCHPCMLW